MPSEDVLGVVLAGGASRRMGRDKARLEIAGDGGEPVSLGEHAARRLAEVCADVVVADGGRGSVPGRRSIADGPGAGPAAGILGAAALRPGQDLLILACDLPRVPAALLGRLADPGEPGGAARVPRWARGVEPLCALYRPAALEHLAERVADGRLALHRWLETVDVCYLEAGEIARFGPPGEIFLNLNRPEDMERLQRDRARSART